MARQYSTMRCCPSPLNHSQMQRECSNWTSLYPDDRLDSYSFSIELSTKEEYLLTPPPPDCSCSPTCVRSFTFLYWLSYRLNGIPFIRLEKVSPKDQLYVCSDVNVLRNMLILGWSIGTRFSSWSSLPTTGRIPVNNPCVVRLAATAVPSVDKTDDADGHIHNRNVVVVAAAASNDNVRIGFSSTCGCNVNTLTCLFAILRVLFLITLLLFIDAIAVAFISIVDNC